MVRAPCLPARTACYDGHIDGARTLPASHAAPHAVRRGGVLRPLLGVLRSLHPLDGCSPPSLPYLYNRTPTNLRASSPLSLIHRPDRPRPFFSTTTKRNKALNQWPTHHSPLLPYHGVGTAATRAGAAHVPHRPRRPALPGRLAQPAAQQAAQPGPGTERRPLLQVWAWGGLSIGVCCCCSLLVLIIVSGSCLVHTTCLAPVCACAVRALRQLAWRPHRCVRPCINQCACMCMCVCSCCCAHV